jgi:thioester reductase-like protein
VSILITGANGYLGSYVVNELLGRTRQKLILMVRGEDNEARTAKLWKGMQLHMDATEFHDALKRIELVHGDLHAKDLGWDDATRKSLLRRVTSVIHAAASLNRKSAKACFNTNLRGGMSVLMFARELANKGKLKRYSFVSTVAVAGHRQDEDIEEDAAIEWTRSDYDPYARTKKFGEHMVREVLAGESFVIFRPGILLGDGAHERTTQFDMVRALVGLADMPVVPLRPTDRIDIVNTAYAGEAIAHIHLMPEPKYDCYHLSSGAKSPTAKELLDSLESVGVTARLQPKLEGPFNWVFRAMNRAPRGSMVAGVGALMKVFWPYIRYNTVFLNDRVVEELGHEPVPFVEYSADLYRWVKTHRFSYPFTALPLPGEEDAA